MLSLAALRHLLDEAPDAAEEVSGSAANSACGVPAAEGAAAVPLASVGGGPPGSLVVDMGSETCGNEVARIPDEANAGSGLEGECAAVEAEPVPASPPVLQLEGLVGEPSALALAGWVPGQWAGNIAAGGCVNDGARAGGAARRAFDARLAEWGTLSAAAKAAAEEQGMAPWGKARAVPRRVRWQPGPGEPGFDWAVPRGARSGAGSSALAADVAAFSAKQAASATAAEWKAWAARAQATRK